MLEQADIADLVTRELSVTVRSVKALAGSVTNQSWNVETSAGTAVVKCCPERDWLNETTALARLASFPAIPAARLLAAGHHRSVPWLILEWINGTPAHSDQARRAAGHAVKHLHGLAAHHFGPAGEPANSWEEVIWRGLEDELADVVTAHLLLPEQAAAIRRAIEDIPPYSGRPRCLHGDLKDVHLHTSNDELVALLDWGDATAGDPLYDVARYSLEGPHALHVFLTGYGPVDLPHEALRGYRLRFTVGCLATELRAGGDWFPTYQARIAADL